MVVCPEELAAGSFGFTSGQGAHGLRKGKLASLNHERAMEPWVLFTSMDVAGGEVRPSLGICGPLVMWAPRPQMPTDRA